MMDIQKFIKILDQPQRIAREFFQKHGKNIFLDEKLLHTIIQEKWSQRKFIRLITLSSIIGYELGQQYRRTAKYFDILPVYEHFHNYMRRGCLFFGEQGVLFKLWTDLGKEQDDNLKIFIKKKQLKSFRRTNLNKEFVKKYRKRLMEFIQKEYCYIDIG